MVAIAICVTSNGDMNIKNIRFNKNILKSLREDFENKTLLLNTYFNASLSDKFFFASNQISAITIDRKMYPRKTRFLGSVKCSVIFEKKSII